MDSGAWWSMVRGVAKVTYNLATKQQQQPICWECNKSTINIV